MLGGQLPGGGNLEQPWTHSNRETLAQGFCYQWVVGSFATSGLCERVHLSVPQFPYLSNREKSNTNILV